MLPLGHLPQKRPVFLTLPLFFSILVNRGAEEGRAVLGLEFGSTRIKAVLVDESHQPVAQGCWDWENSLVDNVWTYSLEDIWEGLRGCYANLAEDVRAKYGVPLTKLAALGFSGMMHGYMPFDAEGELLVPFRTWRNTMTEEACRELTPLFQFNIPQRWSIAHLYQAILNGEEHVGKIAYLTTLAGYIHWKLSGNGPEWGKPPVCFPLIPGSVIMTGKWQRSLTAWCQTGATDGS